MERTAIEDEFMAECATDFHSPCCEQEGLYAHFLCHPSGHEELAGFQCTGCGRNYEPSEKDDFES